MAIKRAGPQEKIVSKDLGSKPTPKIFREALDLFVFSAAFGLLFNLLYTDGIELKVFPPRSIQLTDPRTAPEKNPVRYPGIQSPSPRPRTPSPAANPTPTDALSRISLMGAKERFDSKASLFLDARPSDEYAEGHIPGALNFYADEFDKMAPSILPKLTDKDREIVTYCHGSSCELSIHLARRLSELGYTHVKVFFGGWPEWKKAGYPINAGETP